MRLKLHAEEARTPAEPAQGSPPHRCPIITFLLGRAAPRERFVGASFLLVGGRMAHVVEAICFGRSPTRGRKRFAFEAALQASPRNGPQAARPGETRDATNPFRIRLAWQLLLVRTSGGIDMACPFCGRPVVRDLALLGDNSIAHEACLQFKGQQDPATPVRRKAAPIRKRPPPGR